MIEHIHLFSHKLLKDFNFYNSRFERDREQGTDQLSRDFKCRSILDFCNYRSRTEVAAFRRDAICFAGTSEGSGRRSLILIPLRPR